MALPEYFEFTLPTKVVYGIGVLENIGGSVQRFGKRKAILVTDKVLVEAGPVEKVRDGFAKTNIEIACIFDDTPAEATVHAVEACAKTGRKNGCDMIIAVGGGSVIDTAKVANIILVKGGEAYDHMGAYLLAPDEPLLPSIFIPTTAGTGSEVTKAAVIADPDNNVNLTFVEDQFLPKLAVLDPEATISTSGKLTAATGMDALAHAIEAYVGKEWSPASDAMALHAIRLVSRNILTVCAYPDNPEARGAMLVGSFLAGVAYSHSMAGMAHAVANALGGVYRIPHGIASALVLPEVMEYNLESRVERYADVAVALGISFPQLIQESRSLLKSGSLASVTSKMSQADMLRAWFDAKTYKARGFAAKAVGTFDFFDQWVRKQAAWAGVEKVRTLNRQLAYLTKTPLNLAEAGVTDNLAKLEHLVDTVMEDCAMLYNPVEPDREAVVNIVKKIYDARIKPFPVSEDDIVQDEVRKFEQESKNVFENSDMLYTVLIGFFESLKYHEEIGPALKKAGLCIQFVYKNPDGVITVDCTGDEIVISKGEFDGEPEVTMYMNADFAHRFWHGRANPATALTRRQAAAKGNVSKTIRLLPILKPAYKLYPDYLKNEGFENLVLS